MRIGMVTACYKPVLNGVTRMVALYKEHLEATGHQVTVFTLGDPDPAGEDPGVVRSPALPLGETGYYFAPRYTNAAQALLRQMDIIHCHHLFMSIELASRYGRAPIVYTNHTRYDLYSGTYTPLPQPAADAIMRQIWPELTDLCDVVIAPSEGVRRVMLEFGVRRPIEVIENGVDLTMFDSPVKPLSRAELGLPQAAVVAIYVGRLSSEKGLAQLLRQFAAARDIVPDLHLLLVGKGPQSEELHRLAGQLAIDKTVHFIGPVANETVPAYLAVADFFVTASVSEVHPLTVIEAMAAGLPVVAVASPGIVDTVEPDKSGLLTEHADGGLAAGMVALALDPDRRHSMGQQARQASRRYDIGRTIDRTLALYQKLREERPDTQRHASRDWPRFSSMFEQLAGAIRANRPRDGQVSSTAAKEAGHDS